MKLLNMLLMVSILLMVACQPAKSAAEADYLAQQLACVDEAPTSAEATACRNRVKAAWAVKDAGAE